jgi:uncharacterized protein (TIGR01777 family)
MKRKRILLSGASGLIGSALHRAVHEAGMEVTTLVRRHRQVSAGAVYWNPERSGSAVHPMVLEGIDAVIHLNGASVSRPWTKRYRKEIVESRVGTTRGLCESLARVHERPPVLLVASAVGIYGSRGDETLVEASAAGNGFLAETCRAWEDASEKVAAQGVRVVHLRFGVVLDGKGGMLRKLLPVFWCGLGGKLGSGRQWMSWVSLRDAVRAVVFLLERNDLAGAFNVTAPNPATNAEFTRALGAALHRPAVMTVPAGVLRLGLGEMANQTLLASQRVMPRRLLDAGFTFEDAEIGPALKALLR